ncbi:MAG: MFS transporter [Proteobacteria bacterium]|nr:MFS transporter [Pseudomonadota bacterium]
MHWRNLLAACAAISVFGFALGMTYPLLSLLLEDAGVSTTMIGINAAMMPMGILLFSPVLPLLSKRFGSRQVAIAAAVITALLLPAYKVFDSLEAWFIIRLLQGMSEAALFVLGEAWVVQYAGSTHRGKIVALYGAVLSASFGAGPALVSWIGIHGWLPFLIGAAVILASVIPLWMVQDEAASEVEESAVSGIFSFAAKAPILIAAVGVFAVFDAAALAFLPVYGLRIGLSLNTAALALTALIVGNVILQFPIGWLADRFTKQIVLRTCTLLTVLFAILLPYTQTGIWMWPVLILLGTTGYGIYTVSLADLGDRFSGHELVTGSSAFAVIWGIGALIGSVSGGWAMDLLGPVGLPLLVACSYAVLLAGMLLWPGYHGNRKAAK